MEANPLKAKLVPRAQDWKWSSLGCPRSELAKMLDPWPVERPRDWSALVNRPLKETERRRVLDSLERGRPLESGSWARQMAGRLGLQYTLNRRGSLRKPTPVTRTSAATRPMLWPCICCV